MIYILLVLYASMHGVDNGILYSRKGSEVKLKWLDRFKQDEHCPFVLQRGCLFLMPLVVALYCIDSRLWEIPTEVIAGVLAFSFFHNGFKNITLDEILKRDLGWNGTSTNSVAKRNYQYPVRLGMFLASFGVLAGGYFWL